MTGRAGAGEAVDLTDLAPGDDVVGREVVGRVPSGGSLRGLVLEDCRLDGVVLAGVDLRGAQLRDCVVRGGDLSRVDLTDALLDGLVLERCKALAINFSTARISDLREEPFVALDTRLDLCTWQGLRLAGMRLERCRLHEVELSGCDLRRAEIRDSDLRAARLIDCDLRGATFAGSTGLALDAPLNRCEDTVVPTSEVEALLAPFGLRLDQPDVDQP